jgi:prepilin-type N-terminal cleavage/methylation domain-containing protein
MISVTRQNCGFTLIELMCSMAIGSIILLTAVSVLGSAGDGYTRVSGGMAVEREARAVIAQLTSDLSSAMFHKNVVFEKSFVNWSADRIGFLSLQPADAQADADRIGDLCAVNYYLKNRTINGKTVRCLMRGFHDSRQTFAALGSDAVSSLFAEQSAIDEPIAFNVVSFEARPKSRDASGRWVDWMRDDVSGPAALDLHLVIARRNLAERLIQPGDWDSVKWLGNPSDADRNKDLEIYGAMIRFGNHETH